MMPRCRRDSLAGCASALLLALAAVACAEPVTLSTNDYPPYNSPQLPNNGIVGAISTAAFARMGDRLTIQYRPWPRALKESLEGTSNGVLSAWYSPQRAVFLAYSKPIYANHIGFYARAGHRYDVHDLARLRHLRIGVVRGYLNPPAFDSARLNTDEASDDSSNLRKLALGRVDLVLIDKGLAAYLLKTRLQPLKDQLIWLEPSIATLQLYNGFSKRSPGWQQRLERFNRGLAAIQQDGTAERIVREQGY